MMIIKNALDKLEQGAKEKIDNRYGAVIKTYVHSALEGFCKQDESFAQAVINGGTFAECIKYCTDGIAASSGVSDIDIYRRAVQFYFPGAKVDFKIQIITAGAETIISEEPQRTEVKTKTKKVKTTTEEVKTTTEEVNPTTEETEKEAKTEEPITKTEEPITKSAEPKRKTAKQKQKQDSNMIQLDLFA